MDDVGRIEKASTYLGLLDEESSEDSGSGATGASGSTVSSRDGLLPLGEGGVLPGSESGNLEARKERCGGRNKRDQIWAEEGMAESVWDLEMTTKTHSGKSLTAVTYRKAKRAIKKKIQDATLEVVLSNMPHAYQSACVNRE